MVDAGAIAALVTAIAALAGALLSIQKLQIERRDRDQAIVDKYAEWERGRRKDVADWQVQLLRELYVRRLSVYPSVFRTLGAAIYVKGHGEEIATKAELNTAARDLHDHLYGEAGVLMSPDTRDAVQGARVACEEFVARGGSSDDLINCFWDARRQLRLDVQVLDLSFEKIVSDMSRERKSKPPR